MSKFQKIVLTKILSFFIVITKHTLIFAVHQPKVKISCSWYPLSVICRKIEMEKVLLKNPIDFTPLIPIVFCINWNSRLIQRLIVKIEIFYKSCRKSVNFYYATDQNVIVAGYKYNQCQLFGISIGSQFILVFLQ